MYYNKVTLIGRAHKIYPTRLLENNKRVAIDLELKKDGKDEPYFIQVICFGKLAEVTEEFLATGDMILIDGSIEMIKYEQQGETHYVTQVITERIKFLNAKEVK